MNWNGEIYALAVSGNTLYAGGQFTNAGGITANGVAQWDGTNWSAFGSGLASASGVNGSVWALTTAGTTLYAGGEFTKAGTNVSGYIAVAFTAGVPVVIITNNPTFGISNGMFGFNIFGPSASNVVIQGSTDLRSWISLQTNVFGSCAGVEAGVGLRADHATSAVSKVEIQSGAVRLAA